MSIKQFFSTHAKLFPASMISKNNAEKNAEKKHYHVDVDVPETIEYALEITYPKKTNAIKNFFTKHNAIWASKAVKPCTLSEHENLKNKS